MLEKDIRVKTAKARLQERATKEKEDGSEETTRLLQTSDDGQFMAKDRSGELPTYAEPDLSAVIETILGEEIP